ncbi:hypothetical protein V5O48_000154 [Marasmius crinis-equi]|uniref:NAD-dependent epimerase/dehydratase domain-containing protein n=1 Tax=Marasmius crinis-equi TaxID=585013 RepID=A0ABR3G2J1_9AGAR
MSRIVLVTGASGFLGSAVVKQLLEEGFHVRGTARGQRADDLRKSFTSYNDRFEVVEIADLIEPFPLPEHALKDLWALIHVALYSPKRNDTVQDIVKGHATVTANILEQAEKAKVKHFVCTGTIVAVTNPRGPLTVKHTDWNPITIEEATKANALLPTYALAKKQAELAVWDWADAHPDVEVACIIPTSILGPWTPGLNLSSPSFSGMTPIFWNFIDPEGHFFRNPVYVDVRDVAKAHVRALTHAPPTSEIGRKRVVISSPHGVDWGRTIDLLREKRPNLNDRLIKREPPVFGFDRSPVEFDWIQKVVGMRKEDFFTWEETLLDGIDNFLELEKQWNANGHGFKTPPLYDGYRPLNSDVEKTD